MRDLDECKAEIFRRSEEKIKQRRKARRKMMTGGLSLCLCLVVGTAVIVPALSSKKSTAEGTMDEELHAEELPGAIDVLSVEIENLPGTAPYYQTLTDEAEVTGLYERIRDLCEEAPEDEKLNGYGKDQVKDPMENNYAEGVWEPQNYRITFTAEDGEKRNFVLAGCLLRSEEDGRSWLLEEEAAATLAAALGLPQ